MEEEVCLSELWVLLPVTLQRPEMADGGARQHRGCRGCGSSRPSPRATPPPAAAPPTRRSRAGRERRRPARSTGCAAAALPARPASARRRRCRGPPGSAAPAPARSAAGPRGRAASGAGAARVVIPNARPQRMNSRFARQGRQAPGASTSEQRVFTGDDCKVNLSFVKYPLLASSSKAATPCTRMDHLRPFLAQTASRALVARTASHRPAWNSSPPSS